MAGTPIAGFGRRKVGGITVNVQDHAAGRVLDDGERVGGGVVYEPVAFVLGELGGGGLCGGNCA